MAGIIGGILGGIGSLFGGMGKDEVLRNQRRAIDKMQRENKAWFDRRYNENPTQRADAIRMLTMTEDAIRRRNKAAEGRKALMGGTEESVAAEKEAGSKALADVTSQIAAANERRKDLIEQQYLARKNKLDNMNLELEGNSSSIYDTVGGMIGGMANGLGLFD